MAVTVISGPLVTIWLLEAEQIVLEQADYLTQLDAAIGDGDHGTNISRGFMAVGDAVRTEAEGMTPGEVLGLAGRTILSSVGGASGALWGSALRSAGRQLGDANEVSSEAFVGAIDAAVASVVELGAAAPGDKTMVDALVPAQAAMKAAIDQGMPLAEAARAAADAAAEGARQSTAMEARKGRASYLGPRSVGHQDPGATSSAMIFEAFARAVAA